MKFSEFKSKYGRRAPYILANAYNQNGFKKLSTKLGINTGVLWYWMLSLGVEIKHVAVRKGEYLLVRGVRNGQIYRRRTEGQSGKV